MSPINEAKDFIKIIDEGFEYDPDRTDGIYFTVGMLKEFRDLLEKLVSALERP